MKSIQEIYKLKYLAFTLFWFGLGSRYRNSLLGMAWSLFNPLLQALILFFVFHSLFRINFATNLDYFAYVYSGTVVMQLFSNCLLQGSEQIFANSAVLKTLKLPISLFVLVNLLINWANALISFVPLLLYLSLSGASINIALSYIPLILFSLIIFVLPFSLALNIVVTKFRDVRYFLPLITQLVFYLSPVFYTFDAISSKVVSLLQINPLTYYLNAARYSVLGDSFTPNFYLLITFSAICLLVTFFIIPKLETLKGKLVFLT